MAATSGPRQNSSPDSSTGSLDASFHPPQHDRRPGFNLCSGTGKDDPKLALLRLDAERAEIWLEGSSLIAGIKMLFGSDPKQEFKENVAEVTLTH